MTVSRLASAAEMAVTTSTSSVLPATWAAIWVSAVFDALIAGYTAYRWSREDWQLPAGDVFADDGWIWTP